MQYVRWCLLTHYWQKCGYIESYYLTLKPLYFIIKWWIFHVKKILLWYDYGIIPEGLRKYFSFIIKVLFSYSVSYAHVFVSLLTRFYDEMIGFYDAVIWGDVIPKFFVSGILSDDFPDCFIALTLNLLNFSKGIIQVPFLEPVYYQV